MTRINYERLVDEAMHVIVKKALLFIEGGKVPGDHHFYISFLTNHPGVKISESLRKQYPEEMTIVLQYQFENLVVDDKRFSVTLSFDGAREHIDVPFSALTAFADPSVKFGLQFKHANKHAKFDREVKASSEAQMEIDKKLQDPDFGNVVTFEQFKKAKKG